jgi:hypothetical protein
VDCRQSGNFSGGAIVEAVATAVRGCGRRSRAGGRCLICRRLGIFACRAPTRWPPVAAHDRVGNHRTPGAAESAAATGHVERMTVNGRMVAYDMVEKTVTRRSRVRSTCALPPQSASGPELKN